MNRLERLCNRFKRIYKVIKHKLKIIEKHYLKRLSQNAKQMELIWQDGLGLDIAYSIELELRGYNGK